MKAQNCIVFAADSLTSISGRVVTCTATKIHRLSAKAVAAGCGWAGTSTRKWSDVFAEFEAPTEPDGSPVSTTEIISTLQSSLNGLVDIPRSNVMACQGGNTFLAATCDPATGKLAISRIERDYDARKFENPQLASSGEESSYIEFIGDTTKLERYIAEVKERYVPDTSQDAAISFAQEAIKGAIPIARKASVATIGGSLVRVLVLTKEDVVGAECASGVKCAISLDQDQTALLS